MSLWWQKYGMIVGNKQEIEMLFGVLEFREENELKLT